MYLYSSSQPIVISAAELRDAITNKIYELDPKGQDPALQQMVVIGHSQGGLADQTHRDPHRGSTLARL
jgi:hypothetical protein